ncbi:hypothetical protein PsorP6_014083 [Peronosclerospora sorghi]|uniref:Uncharacterized protein n=1 Tax=Peronosclerospora sorghi TaxID=230839 RepID=A0ACC0VKN3_9STRA|nr:hypothetical protein PsorP6_014083 [Peronosclerospora sorghi]
MDQRLPKVRLRSQRLDVLVGKRLKILIDGWAADSTYPNGHYVGILGASGNLQTELSSLLVDNEVEEAPFSEAALAFLPTSDDCPIDIEGDCVAECSKAKRPAQCGLLNWKLTDEEIVQRRDLRTTVDPQECQDIDDAMSIQRLSNGNIELGVHISDVSYFVNHGSALDMEARRRGTTVYLVIPIASSMGRYQFLHLSPIYPIGFLVKPHNNPQDLEVPQVSSLREFAYLYRQSHLGSLHIHTAYLLFVAPALRLPSMHFTLQCEQKSLSDRSRRDHLCNLLDDIPEYEEKRQSHDVRSDDETVNEECFGESSIAR